LNIALDIQPGRAGQAARGFIALFNGECPRNGLRICLVGGFADRQSFVVVVGQLYRADFGALSAAGAFGQVDEAGFLPDAGFETPRLAFQVEKFGVCQKLDVKVPADLDQFGRDNSHGTIIGGKRLVEL
jgi:hypothetical protein